jgi:chromosome segregation ATPase
MENKNILNRFLMRKILDLYENENDDNKNNKETNKKIIALKKQIIFYNNKIKENDAKINILKNKQRQKRYQELMDSLNIINKDITELLVKTNELNFALFKCDTKIQYYSLQCKDFNDKINEINFNIDIYNTKRLENDKEIKNDNEKFKHLNDIQEILDQEVKINEIEKKNLEDEKNKLSEEIEYNKEYFEERDKNNKILINLQREQSRLELEINKIKKKKNIINNINNKFLENINGCEEERQNLLEKAKILKNNQEKMKELENCINNLKNKIQKTSEEYKNTENNININIHNFINMKNNYRKALPIHPPLVRGLRERSFCLRGGLVGMKN